jgi:hypothetical protein
VGFGMSSAERLRCELSRTVGPGPAIPVTPTLLHSVRGQADDFPTTNILIQYPISLTSKSTYQSFFPIFLGNVSYWHFFKQKKGNIALPVHLVVVKK